MEIPPLAFTWKIAMCRISYSVQLLYVQHWQISLAFGSQFRKLQPDIIAISSDEEDC